MKDSPEEQRVSCRRCRYRFPVEVQPGEDWGVEAQCPCCEVWACFSVADTRDPPPPDPKAEAQRLEALEAEAQRLGEILWRPINENRSHPAVAWVDQVGNGGFKDDHTPKPWAIPTFWVYRFRRGKMAAYIWREGAGWLVRAWHPMRSRRQPPWPVEVFSFEAALDLLAGQP